jgi:transcriptional regulator GlxA family with amidase domain
MPQHVSLVAIPEVMVSTLSGLHDVLGSLRSMLDVAELDAPLAAEDEFRVEIVGLDHGPVRSASGLPIEIGRSIDTVDRSDIIIVPSLFVPRGDWHTGRCAPLVDWITAQHARGAVLCSACSGLFLLAETGLFDERESTIHWSYAHGFGRLYPKVRLQPERALVAAGESADLISSGASTSWHDLALYLIARYMGVTVAQAAAKFFALQWHEEGLRPYVVFSPRTDHGDAIIARAQEWLANNFSVASPVDEMAGRSGLASRSFKRRFTAATGLAPLTYVQRLRIEESRRRLERTRDPVDEIAWRVGYEDPAFFRRLFRRVTGLTPGAYRRRFQLPRLC